MLKPAGAWSSGDLSAIRTRSAPVSSAAVVMPRGCGSSDASARPLVSLPVCAAP